MARAEAKRTMRRGGGAYGWSEARAAATAHEARAGWLQWSETLDFWVGNAEALVPTIFLPQISMLMWLRWDKKD